ncbi:MAG TPA: hypothetical protein VKR32_14970 [Puia sp.]|nr:hypothetical protein [Puia sp.]
MNETHHCLECGHSITTGIFNFSTEEFGVPLCMKHQHWLRESKASETARSLYFALKENGAAVVLEYSDGKKTVDIAIPGKLYIEVNGSNHQEPDQALTDFLRSLHSWKENIPTLNVSNEHIWNSYYFGILVDRLTELSRDQKMTG